MLVKLSNGMLYQINFFFSLRSLYELLIAPFEEHLPQSTSGSPKELMLVLEGDLFLVPFPVLKALNSSEYLSERFVLFF